MRTMSNFGLKAVAEPNKLTAFVPAGGKAFKQMQPDVAPRSFRYRIKLVGTDNEVSFELPETVEVNFRPEEILSAKK